MLFSKLKLVASIQFACYRSIHSSVMAFLSEKKDTVYRLFEDSSHAENYSKYRPTYPEELKQSILSYMIGNGYDRSAASLTLDIGCGTGISTRLFGSSFTAVWGIDISHEQLKQAVGKCERNVSYVESLAETTCFKDNTFDLITVGQAWHWFDKEKFNAEIARILSPNGFLAIFGYSRPKIINCEEADEKHSKFHFETLAPYWSERRQLVDGHYSDMALPFDTRSRVDTLYISLQVSLNGFMEYVNTLSAVQLMKKMNPGTDRLGELRRELAVAIGGSGVEENYNPVLDIRSPLFLELAKKT